MREALRCTDAKTPMASDSKARRCLPALFPQSAVQPTVDAGEPLEEDICKFRRELRRAYSFAPAHRAAGPGCGRNEHWSWMPLYEGPWLHVENLQLRFALARLPPAAMEALMSARILAADRDEHDKVRPLALGVIHRRLTSKAVGRVFKTRVAAAVGPQEYSLGSKGGAELMHKSVLVGLDSRNNIVKVSLDANNAHNEFNRDVAAQCVLDDVPDMLPWAKASLSVAAVHEHVGQDGTRTELKKTKGGDQGDALTNLIFPLTYKKVTLAVRAAMAPHDPNSHVYSFQDDLECVCDAMAVPHANATYDTACSSIDLRANPSKTRLSPGRGVSANHLPVGLEIDQRAFVLRHGDGVPVPALPATNHAVGSQLAEGSVEVQNIGCKRARFYQRLGELRAAGLRAQSTMDMLRARTAGDYVFTARACGIPPREAAALDAGLLLEIKRLPGFDAATPDAIFDQKCFLRVADGGLGFQSAARTSPAAHAASWHACLPKILNQYDLSGTSALMAVSPWAASCLPLATTTLRQAVGDDSLDIGDDGIAASQHTLAKALTLRPQSLCLKKSQLTSRPRQLCAVPGVLGQASGRGRLRCPTSSYPTCNSLLL